ncbi:hypothetical protein EC988_009732, partial [Linderina pennispora]
LLTDVIDRHKEVSVTGRRQRAALRKCSRLIEKQDDERKAKLGIYKRPEQAERAERENHRRLAKWTVQQVMKRWAYVESIMNDQRQMEEEEKRSKEDKRVLFNMLERSTQYLEEQRADFSAAGKSSIDPSEQSSSDSALSDDEATNDQTTMDMESDVSDTDAQVPAEQSDVEFSSESEEDSDDELKAMIAEQQIDVEELRRRYFEQASNAASLPSSPLPPSSALLSDDDDDDDEEAVVSPEQSDVELE